MRNAFADELTKIAAADGRVVLLSGDIGNRLFDPFKARFADRFHNCGIAEQSMIGVAAGLSMHGLRPVVYTIAPFVTARCLEQVRVDLCYHGLPAVLVGVGAGLSYASLGATHHACEDIAMLRCLPGMTVVCPGDAVETRCALRAALRHDGPVYLRLGKKGEPVVHDAEPDFALGRGIALVEGEDVCVLATGNILPLAVEAGRALHRLGCSTRVVSVHTVKPMDVALLRESFAAFRLVATLEEHSLIGGLGSAVAEWLADEAPGTRARLLRIGTPDAFVHNSGSQEQAREGLGLTSKAVVARIVEAARRVRPAQQMEPAIP
jgi:transketolase